MAIMEVVVAQSYYNQVIINRFNFLSGGIPAAVTHSFALSQAIGANQDYLDEGAFAGESLLETQRLMQVVQLAYTSIYVRDLYSNVDFYELPIVSGVNGALTGVEGFSPAVTMAFRSSRVRTDIDRGRKRLAGQPETWTTGGGVWATTGSPQVLSDQYAGKLAEVLSYTDEGNSLTYTPIVLGTERYNAGTVEAPVWKYRRHLTEAEQLANIASGMIWQLVPNTRSQNSRQYGKGI